MKTHGELKKSVEQSKIIEFNQKYQQYKGRGIDTIGTDLEGNEIKSLPLTYQEVASLINLANNDNKNRNFPIQTDSNFEIKIYLNTTLLDNSLNWINAQKDSTDKFDCIEVHIDEETTLVDRVTIRKHT